MITKGNKQITEIYFGKKPVFAVYKGNKIIWERSNPIVGGIEY